MKSIHFAILTLLGIWLSGCSTIRVSSDYARDANFNRLRTYSWAGPQPITGDPRLDNDILHARIRNAVERELALKGYEKMTAGNPDFKIAYHVGLEQKLDVTTFNYYDYRYPASYHPRYGFSSYPGAWPASETRVFQYEEGTLLVDIVDPGTKQLIWRGSATATVNPSDSSQKKDAKINKAVHQLLSQFPPPS
jgi:hypothetical protein